MNHYPSIFNDVVGPVMRGPSSSHSAAGLRIGRIARDLMGGEIRKAHIAYDPNGALVTTHESQGTDMGLYGGFLGWEPHDKRLLHYKEAIQEAGIHISVDYVSYGAVHPNTYKLTLTGEGETHELLAISTGGGMIEVQSIDGATVCMRGDFFETLVYVETPNPALAEQWDKQFEEASVQHHEGTQPFIHIRTTRTLTSAELAALTGEETVLFVRTLAPVLPTLSRKDLSVPFATCREMLDYNQEKNLALWELAVEYECRRGDTSKQEVFETMRKIVHIITDSVNEGLDGTDYHDRILPAQSVLFKAKSDANELIGNDVQNQIIMYVSALMEVKSAMGVLVAAPTAGSCGAFPGTVLATAHCLKKDEDEIVKAMLAGGMIGIYIAAGSTFAAESAGCQAECGSGSAMAAAALVHLGGGSLDQALGAASMALQNCSGMVCDPIGNRVEAPCLGKNVIAGVNALACANMALARYQHLIPLDEVVDAFDYAGRSIDRTLRCTALGGLSVSKTAKTIEVQLKQGTWKNRNNPGPSC